MQLFVFGVPTLKQSIYINFKWINKIINNFLTIGILYYLGGGFLMHVFIIFFNNAFIKFPRYGIFEYS